MSNIEDLKSEAASLGIRHNASIGEAKLKEKIEEFYASQETSGAAVKELVEKKAKIQEKETQKTPESGLDSKIAKRLAREKEARKLRIVSIVDNDQRSNNHTTTCVVNCSNEFFDLGTRILPLGEKIEVAQGHLNVLKEVTITLHALDSKTGLSMAKTRKRYSISYEDMQ